MKGYCINCKQETDFVVAYINIDLSQKNITTKKTVGNCINCREWICMIEVEDVVYPTESDKFK